MIFREQHIHYIIWITKISTTALITLCLAESAIGHLFSDTCSHYPRWEQFPSVNLWAWLSHLALTLPYAPSLWYYLSFLFLPFTLPLKATTTGLVMIFKASFQELTLHTCHSLQMDLVWSLVLDTTWLTFKTLGSLFHLKNKIQISSFLWWSQRYANLRLLCFYEFYGNTLLLLLPV